jgi:hypothetical protein
VRRHRLPAIACLLLTALLPACAALMGSATGGLANNLGAAILNQDDPETVRDGAPAFLLMLDSFVEGAPNDSGMLRAAAELYAAYGIVFVDDPDRAMRLTSRSRDYGRRALCSANADVCGIWSLPHEAFLDRLERLRSGDTAAAYAAGVSWLAYIRAHRSDWSALAELPAAEALLVRVRSLDSSFQPSDVEHYLAVMNTLRPPALGGDFEAGLRHFENALSLSEGNDLSIKVDYARYYARTLYDRELHDRLLKEVIKANPVQDGRTLFNTLAQREAKDLLESGDHYF